MNSSIKMSKRFQLSAMILSSVFLLTATFGILVGMQTNEGGAMVGCPFMSHQSSFCSMGVFEHIAKWQELFAAVVSESTNTLLLIALLLALSAFLNIVRRPNILSALALSPPVVSVRPETTLFNYFILVFSQGILHPRLYA